MPTNIYLLLLILVDGPRNMHASDLVFPASPAASFRSGALSTFGEGVKDVRFEASSRNVSRLFDTHAFRNLVKTPLRAIRRDVVCARPL